MEGAASATASASPLCPAMSELNGGGAEEAPAGFLSSRGGRIAGNAKGLLDKAFDMYIGDPFDADHNPEGILNFGTSENKLCFDLIQERVSLVSRELHRLLNCEIRISPSSSILVIDGYLIPAPYYGGINSKTWLYGGIQVTSTLGLVLKDSNVADSPVLRRHFGVSNYQFFFFQGIRVRALILINPHNPLGDIYPAQLLKECLEFAHRHTLHVIMDEIYMLSVYDDTTFTSILSLESLPDPERTHFMWGFSKDFGMCGIRVGVLYTRNHEIRKAVNQLAVFHGCPGPVQHVLSQFLSDRDWLNNVFFPTNKRRLKEAQNILVSGLAEMGIPVLKSSGGLYVWADFRKFLKSQTFEAETDLWWKLLDEKLLISPGKAFCCYEPGWFRLVFSDSVDKIYLCKSAFYKTVNISFFSLPHPTSPRQYIFL
uniref:Aminotransferase class I/classII large domain-containing protein n=1 Tax=Salvator merianae TaxID=96440 RepID=A0A8D0BXF7_SALMN